MSFQTSEQIKKRLVDKKLQKGKVQLIDPESYVLWEGHTAKIFIKSKEFKRVLQDSRKASVEISPSESALRSYPLAFKASEDGEIVKREGYDSTFSSSYFGNSWPSSPYVVYNNKINPFIVVDSEIGEGVYFDVPWFININPDQVVKAAIDDFLKQITLMYKLFNHSVFASVSCSIDLVEVP